MNYRIKAIFFVLVILMLTISSSYAVPAKSETIEIKELNGTYELSVPISQLIMTIPKNGLTQEKNTYGGGADNPRYFFFGDSTSNLYISGWFESSERFLGVKKQWEDDTKQWKKDARMPEPENVTFTKLDNWDMVSYELKTPKFTSYNLRAHWVQAGTWIDIHLSITSARPAAEMRAQLLSILKSIQVKQKT